MKQVDQTNCLQAVNPKLAAEWHPTRNGDFTPKDVLPGSSKKAWWQCSQGHEWQTVIGNRNMGTGCPYCYGKKVDDTNCLQTFNPQLAKEWHPTKNGDLTPKDVRYNYHKKAWWRCSKGHEWEYVIAYRSRGSCCLVCATLQVVNPQLATEWHPTKNGNLTPKNIRPHSHKKVWWQCSKGHEWETLMVYRSKGRGCPYCKGSFKAT